MRKITLKVLTKLPTRYGTNGLILIIVLFGYGILGSYFIMNLSFVDSIYYSVITMTTVGYGDVYPVTVLGKILSAIIALLGIGLVAVPTGIISSGFVESMEEKHKAQEEHDKKCFCPYCGKKLK